MSIFVFILELVEWSFLLFGQSAPLVLDGIHDLSDIEEGEPLSDDLLELLREEIVRKLRLFREIVGRSWLTVVRHCDLIAL